MNRILQISDSLRYKEYTMRSKRQYENISLRQDKDLNQLINYIYEI